MAFFKFRQRGQPAAEAPARSRGKNSAASSEETVDTLRRRARYRLVGAAVLVLAAVVGFPLVFDTQPRPVAVDVPITIPDKNSTAPLKIPEPVPADASLGDREEVVAASTPSAEPRPASSAARPAAPSAEPRARADAATRNDEAKAKEAAAKARREEADSAKRDADARTKRDQEAEAARAKREDARAAQARRDEEQRAKARREDDTAAKEAAAADAKAKRDEARRDEAAKREQQARDKREAEQRAKRDEAARARALLEGRASGADKAPADEGKSRFVVQVGAFSDDAAVREARQKAERAGVKTYTQVVNTSAGPRTRVRVGPYGTRAEAEKAAAALKKAGLSGAIVSF